MTTRHLEHAATPLRKSVMAEMEREFAEDFAATAASTFRASSNISVTNSLYHYYTLMSGRSVVQKSAAVKYVDTTVKAGLRDMDSLLAKRSMDFFCLNDGSAPEIDLELRTRKITEFWRATTPSRRPGKPRRNKGPADFGWALATSVDQRAVTCSVAPEWQSEIVTQRRSFVVTAEDTSILQQRHHVVDELVEAGRHEVRPEDESVRTVVADKRIYFLGNLLRCTHDRSTLELIDHHFAQIQLLALGDRAQFCHGRETIW